MQVWLRDDAVLGRRGGSQADLRQGDAEFQALRMADFEPTQLRDKTTLREFLAQQWPDPVAAVGLSAYGDDVESTAKLNGAILDLLGTMGFETGPEHDVLELAGLDVSGVGVRRPEIYIKLGRGVVGPYVTLRHPEWGGTRGYNVCLASWDPCESLL